MPEHHRDDEFHPPTSDDLYRTETCWFTVTVPGRGPSGQLRGGQPRRCDGRITLDGEELTVDSSGFRHRSWGPRSPFGRGVHGTPAARGGFSHTTPSDLNATNEPERHT